MRRAMSNQKPMHSDPVLTVQDGKVTASSRDIARKFGKRHRDFVRAIEDYEIGRASCRERV